MSEEKKKEEETVGIRKDELIEEVKEEVPKKQFRKEPELEETIATDKPIELLVSFETAFNMQLLEFDKLIFESEAKTAQIRSQKANYAYDQNLQNIKDQHDKNKIKQEAEALILAKRETK